MLTVCAALSSGCGTEGEPGTEGDCATYDAAEGRTSGSDLDVSLGSSDAIKVSRSDGSRMDYGSASLYADSVAGCRVFSLTLDGDGPRSTDVTNQKEFMAGSLVSPDAKSETYRLPPSADKGTYLFCVEAVDPNASSEVCGRFDL